MFLVSRPRYSRGQGHHSTAFRVHGDGRDQSAFISPGNSVRICIIANMSQPLVHVEVPIGTYTQCALLFVVQVSSSLLGCWFLQLTGIPWPLVKMLIVITNGAIYYGRWPGNNPLGGNPVTTPLLIPPKAIYGGIRGIVCYCSAAW